MLPKMVIVLDYRLIEQLLCMQMALSQMIMLQRVQEQLIIMFQKFTQIQKGAFQVGAFRLTLFPFVGVIVLRGVVPPFVGLIYNENVFKMVFDRVNEGGATIRALQRKACLNVPFKKVGVPHLFAAQVHLIGFGANQILQSRFKLTALGVAGILQGVRGDLIEIQLQREKIRFFRVSEISFSSILFEFGGARQF